MFSPLIDPNTVVQAQRNAFGVATNFTVTDDKFQNLIPERTEELLLLDPVLQDVIFDYSAVNAMQVIFERNDISWAYLISGILSVNPSLSTQLLAIVASINRANYLPLLASIIIVLNPFDALQANAIQSIVRFDRPAAVQALELADLGRTNGAQLVRVIKSAYGASFGQLLAQVRDANQVNGILQL